MLLQCLLLSFPLALFVLKVRRVPLQLRFELVLVLEEVQLRLESALLIRQVVALGFQDLGKARDLFVVNQLVLGEEARRYGQRGWLLLRGNWLLDGPAIVDHVEVNGRHLARNRIS